MCQGGGHGASGVSPKHQAPVTEWVLVLCRDTIIGTEIQEGEQIWEQKVQVSGLGTLSVRCLQNPRGEEFGLEEKSAMEVWLLALESGH